MNLTNEDKLRRDLLILHSNGWCLDYIINQILLHSKKYGTGLNYQNVELFVKNATKEPNITNALSTIGAIKTISQINLHEGYMPSTCNKKITHSADRSNQVYQLCHDDANAAITHRDEIEKKAIRERKAEAENKLQVEYLLAINILDFFNIEYKAKRGLINIIQYFLSNAIHLFNYRKRIISIAHDYVYSSIKQEDHRNYIIKNSLEPDPFDYLGNFIYNTYHRKYLRARVTHCFRCKRQLSTSLTNECQTCGWIRCRCGACGCSYHNRIY